MGLQVLNCSSARRRTRPRVRLPIKVWFCRSLRGSANSRSPSRLRCGQPSTAILYLMCALGEAPPLEETPRFYCGASAAKSESLSSHGSECGVTNALRRGVKLAREKLARDLASMRRRRLTPCCGRSTRELVRLEESAHALHHQGFRARTRHPTAPGPKPQLSPQTAPLPTLHRGHRAWRCMTRCSVSAGARQAQPWRGQTHLCPAASARRYFNCQWEQNAKRTHAAATACLGI